MSVEQSDTGQNTVAGRGSEDPSRLHAAGDHGTPDVPSLLRFPYPGSRQLRIVRSSGITSPVDIPTEGPAQLLHRLAKARLTTPDQDLGPDDLAPGYEGGAEDPRLGRHLLYLKKRLGSNVINVIGTGQERSVRLAVDVEYEDQRNLAVQAVTEPFPSKDQHVDRISEKKSPRIKIKKEIPNFDPALPTMYLLPSPDYLLAFIAHHDQMDTVVLKGEFAPAVVIYMAKHPQTSILTSQVADSAIPGKSINRVDTHFGFVRKIFEKDLGIPEGTMFQNKERKTMSERTLAANVAFIEAEDIEIEDATAPLVLLNREDAPESILLAPALHTLVKMPRAARQVVQKLPTEKANAQDLGAIVEAVWPAQPVTTATINRARIYLDRADKDLQKADIPYEIGKVALERVTKGGRNASEMGFYLDLQQQQTAVDLPSEPNETPVFYSLEERQKSLYLTLTQGEVKHTTRIYSPERRTVLSFLIDSGGEPINKRSMAEALLDKSSRQAMDIVSKVMLDLAGEIDPTAVFETTIAKGQTFVVFKAKRAPSVPLEDLDLSSEDEQTQNKPRPAQSIVVYRDSGKLGAITRGAKTRVLVLEPAEKQLLYILAPVVGSPMPKSNLVLRAQEADIPEGDLNSALTTLEGKLAGDDPNSSSIQHGIDAAGNETVTLLIDAVTIRKPIEDGHTIPAEEIYRAPLAAMNVALAVNGDPESASPETFAIDAPFTSRRSLIRSDAFEIDGPPGNETAGYVPLLPDFTSRLSFTDFTPLNPSDAFEIDGPPGNETAGYVSPVNPQQDVEPQAKEPEIPVFVATDARPILGRRIEQRPVLTLEDILYTARETRYEWTAAERKEIKTFTNAIRKATSLTFTQIRDLLWGKRKDTKGSPLSTDDLLRILRLGSKARFAHKDEDFPLQLELSRTSADLRYYLGTDE